jgi:hypothetical protein
LGKNIQGKNKQIEELKEDIQKKDKKIQPFNNLYDLWLTLEKHKNEMPLYCNTYLNRDFDSFIYSLANYTHFNNFRQKLRTELLNDNEIPFKDLLIDRLYFQIIEVIAKGRNIKYEIIDPKSGDSYDGKRHDNPHKKDKIINETLLKGVIFEDDKNNPHKAIVK